MDTDRMTELPPQVKQHMTRYKAPPGLERRVRHMLLQESRKPGWLERLRARFPRWLPLAVSFACGMLLASSVFTVLAPEMQQDQMEQQVVAGHVRSLMANHLMDVASTDQHTVKPWFTGKLDFAPPVVDLSAQGFPLVGGRLDYLQGRPVAALVYRKGAHTINVFVLPGADAGRSTRPEADVRQGFQLARWQAGGMHFWAVSDMGREEMAAFAQALSAAR
jgi:anti-sigma factor RsiW